MICLSAGSELYVSHVLLVGCCQALRGWLKRLKTVEILAICWLVGIPCLPAGKCHHLNVECIYISANGFPTHRHLIEYFNGLKNCVVHGAVSVCAFRKRRTIMATNQRLRLPEGFMIRESTPKYGYLSGYKKPMGLTEQADRLRDSFSDHLGFINPDYQARIEKGEILLPPLAEGWFCIPNWIMCPRIFGKTYSSAVRKVLEMLNRAHGDNFQNLFEGEIDEMYLCRSERTGLFFQDLSHAQGNPDILIVPAQFGMHHRAKSIQDARMGFLSNEFGLDTLAIGCMLLTHPNRLAQHSDLCVNCAGDEFFPGENIRFARAPSFEFRYVKLELTAVALNSAYPRRGSASAFLPIGE